MWSRSMDSLRVCCILVKNQSSTLENNGVGHQIKMTCLGYLSQLGRWLIVFSIVFHQISGGDISFTDAHTVVGILLAAQVIFRLVWGFMPTLCGVHRFPISTPQTTITDQQMLNLRKRSGSEGVVQLEASLFMHWLDPLGLQLWLP